MDNLANALVNLKNCENATKRTCVINPASKLVGNILKIMKKHEYIKDMEYVDDGKAGYYNVHLHGGINNCKTIKPRYAVKCNEFTKWEKRYLPAKGFGILIVSTPKGIMSHIDAKKLNTGGKLLAFIY